ncbi:E3 ubiquitin-protein ligase E3D-like isoform X4 [Corticium candelabrum]|uniref:E3 ubiquitin-protein ligase E3D-like isoform X4 n=1 Tax=Corticium candelabrum TaxID=121492 RepID=UPI002E260D52|nr:E3 ubiquitin-protein ligase E3D-like isoform X4 [Corticium candelabrum]
MEPVYLLECKRGIETVQLSLDLTRLRRESMLRVEADRLLLDRAVPFPSCMNVVPSSCRNLEVVDGAVLTMRFRAAKWNDKLDINPTSKDENEIQRFVGMACRLTVLGSKVDILRHVVFKRILPLPSDDWEDIATTAWFCHCRHCQISNSDAIAHHSHSMEHHKISPLPYDCLYDDVKLVVHHSVLCKDIIGVREAGKCANSELLVYCKPCRTVIGLARRAEYNEKDVWHVNVGCQLVAVSHVFLWRHLHNMYSEGHEVSFSDFDTDEESLERFVAIKLLRELKHQTHRFVLQGLPPESTVYACLWLMNSDVKLFTNCCFTTIRHLTDKRKSKRNNGESRCFGVVKLLYKLMCTDNASVRLGIQWQRDASCQSIVLPADGCLEIVVLLSTNCMTLPLSQRIANDFKVSYLRR